MQAAGNTTTVSLYGLDVRGDLQDSVQCICTLLRLRVHGGWHECNRYLCNRSHC